MRLIGQGFCTVNGALRERGYPEEFISSAQRLLHDPGISVVAPALLAGDTTVAHSVS